MKNQFLFVLLFITGFSFGQTRVQFQYDNEGNQTARIICNTCNAKTARDSTMTVATVKESDMIKDVEYKQISYYPNPVQEELYIKWVNEGSKYVTGISVFSISGQSIEQYHYTKQNEIATIPFLNYPNGYYNVVLFYNDGERKTLKVLKK
jgi:hypothetical protein